MNWELFTALSGLAVVFASYHWRLTGIERRILKHIDESTGQLERDVNQLRHELLHSKLEAANAFMRKESFKDVMTNMEARFIRMEGKLDSTMASVKERK